MSARDPVEVVARAIMRDADFADDCPTSECPSCVRRAGVILAALTAAGYAVVPCEPSEARLKAVQEWCRAQQQVYLSPGLRWANGSRSHRSLIISTPCSPPARGDAGDA